MFRATKGVHDWNLLGLLIGVDESEYHIAGNIILQE